MNNAKMLAKLRVLLEDTDPNNYKDSDDTLLLYLDIAGKKIIEKAYPFGDESEDVPEKYQLLQIQIAQFLLNKRGAEGETEHTETGNVRTYENADIPDSMLKRVIPIAKVLG